MRNYFRKYFLIFAFLLSQEPIEAMEIKFTWILSSLYATITKYLPTFSLPSFLTKYEFRKKKIQENKQENTENRFFLLPFLNFFINFTKYKIYCTQNGQKQEDNQKQENRENQNNIINNGNLYSYTSGAFFTALEAAWAHKLNEKDKLDAEISKPLHELSKLLDEIDYLNQKIEDKTYKHQNKLNGLKTDLNNKINKKDDLQKKVQEFVNQGANATYLAYLDRIWGYYQKTRDESLSRHYTDRYDRLARTIKTAQNFDYNTTLKKITEGIEETHSINVPNLCKNFSECAKKYKQYELNAEFLNAIEIALMHNFKQEEDLEKIKEYINQGADNVYLQNLFKKEPEYAEKYNQRYEIALLHAVKIAKKNHFEQKEDLEKIKIYINKGANPDYPIGSKKQTLLMFISTYGNKDLFDFLLTKEININASDINQNNVLHKLAFLYRKAYIMEDHSNPRLFTSEIYILENLLQHGADANAINISLETPLLVAIDSHATGTEYPSGCYLYFIKSLITNTNVNQTDKSRITPLCHAIYTVKRSAKTFCISDLSNFDDFKVLESLYKAGSSLINLDRNNNSIFHLLVGIKNRKHKHLEQHIKAILTHTQDPHKKQNQESGERIRDSHLGLTNLNIPLDIQCLIFSFLPDFSGADIDTIELLIKNKPQNIPTLYRTMNQMIQIQNVLQHQNSSGKTPLQALKHTYNPEYENTIKNLFDENKPKNDFITFLKAFPNIKEVPEDNWAGIAYHYLLENKK